MRVILDHIRQARRGPAAWLHASNTALIRTVIHDGIEHAGYLAFLGMLSFFPFLVFFVALAGLIGEARVSAEFLEIVVGNMPPQLVEALTPRIVEIVSGPPQGLLTVAILGVIWTASSAVEGLRTILNRAYHVKTPPAYIWRRLLSIVQFLALTTAAMLTTMALILFPLFWNRATEWMGIPHDAALPQHLWPLLRYGLGGGTLFMAVCISYYILPNLRQSFRFVAPGALVVVIAWISATELLTFYLRTFDQVNLVYGSLGGIIAALLFFYVLALIYIFGAEFNHALKEKHTTKPSRKKT